MKLTNKFILLSVGILLTSFSIKSLANLYYCPVGIYCSDKSISSCSFIQSDGGWRIGVYHPQVTQGLYWFTGANASDAACDYANGESSNSVTFWAIRSDNQNLTPDRNAPGQRWSNKTYCGSPVMYGPQIPVTYCPWLSGSKK